MVHFLIRRPIAVIMVFIAVIMLGIVSYRLLPVALMPDIDIPEITIQVSYPNSTARELDNAVIRNLRSQLLQVTHLKDITSETRDGESTIRLSFDYGISVDYAFIEVNEKIDGAMNSLPRDMKRPRVIKASVSDLPVFYLNVSLKNDSTNTTRKNKFLELSEFCEEVIRKRMEQLPQVAMVDLSGSLFSEIVITPDRQKLESLSLTYNQIQQAVDGSNINPGSLMVRDGYYQYYIRFTSYLKTPEDIGNIYLRANDKILQLKDVCDISIKPQKPRGYFLTGDQEGITLAVIQQADAKMSDLKKELRNLINRFQRDYPDLRFEISQDQSRLLDVSISNLLQDLIMGGTMAFLVLFLFLGDIRSPVLIGITVPVSLIISLLFFKIFNLSINIISLAGLALGLGMIIDCSIIVMENIFHHMHRGETIGESCTKGTNEVIRPMLSSTLTTSAVFLPLIFLSGMAGALFYDEAVSVSLGNGASFIVAITLLPVLFMVFYRKKKTSHSETKRKFTRLSGLKSKTRNFVKKLNILQSTERFYELGVEWVFKHKFITTGIFLGILSASVVLYFIIKKEKLPALPQTELLVNIDWNENIHLDENRRRVEGIIHDINNYLEQNTSLIGEQQFVLHQERELDYYQSELYLKMKSSNLVGKVRDTIQEILMSKYPNAGLTFSPPTNIFEQIFSNNDPPLLAKVSLNESAKTHPDSILSFVNEADSRLKNPFPNRIPLKQQLTIDIDQEKLILYNVDYNTVVQSLKTAFNENQFSTLRSYNRFMPILIGEDSRLVNEILLSGKVQNSKKEDIPLNALVTIRHGYDLKHVTAGQQGEYIPLHYMVSADQMDNHQKTIKNLVNEKHYPDVRFAGSISDNNLMFKELGVILIISLLLLYFILSAQFESLLQPLIILLEIPANIAGAFLMLWLFGSSLNIMSGIGIIVGCGVFINDSIIKVDTINQLRRQGMPLMQAIKTGGVLRVGGIVMTAATTILAVVPFFFGNDMGSALQKPLSLALIGGMTVGTFVSLFFVPLVYWRIYRNEKN